MKKIYLDYAAATPLDKRVLDVMEPYFSDHFYNPSALYLGAKAVSKDVNDARSRIAGWLGARPGEVIFTAGGTEANNLAIHGVMEEFPSAKLLVSSIEHESVLNPSRKYDRGLIPCDEQGIVKVRELEKLIDDHTVLVSVMYANNEIGTIQPLREIAWVIKSKVESRKKAGNKLPLYFHTDACQAPNYLDIHADRLGVDMMTLNGGKIYGPKQSGILYVKAGTRLQPQILGGGQEMGMRSGTENPAAIMGFAKALDLAQENRRLEITRLGVLQLLFNDLILKEIKEAVINGSGKHRLPNNVHITITGTDNERLIMGLDETGIQAAVGSACSASSDEPSHVLKAIGLSEAEARSSLRFTMGRFTTEADVRRATETLAKVVV